MRYTTDRKYPITQMKKKDLQNSSERAIEISIGAAAGLLAVVFLEGLFWGYMINRLRK
jgi:hypothetical protein